MYHHLITCSGSDSCGRPAADRQRQSAHLLRTQQRSERPVLTSATSNGTTTPISFTLNSAPNSTYRIEFFAADPTGQGEQFLGSTTVTTNKNGQVTGKFTFTGFRGSAVTATATDSTGDTSAFAAPVSLRVSQGHKKH